MGTGAFNIISKNDIIGKAYECGFGDIGFTTADSFNSQRELLQERQKEYEWAYKMGLDLMAGTNPKQIFPDARTIIVLLEVYFKEAFHSGDQTQGYIVLHQD
jgi:epoxyqueuosine reductase